jgi:hypothetical protein
MAAIEAAIGLASDETEYVLLHVADVPVPSLALPMDGEAEAPDVTARATDRGTDGGRHREQHDTDVDHDSGRLCPLEGG